MTQVIIRAAAVVIMAIGTAVAPQNAQTTPAALNQDVLSTSTEAQPTHIATPSAEEIRQTQRAQKVYKLQKYLESHSSPLADNAQDFIDAAEQYELDWKLVASIAGVESTFGKHIASGTHNAWGWGGGYIRFESWRDGIYSVSKGLSEKYVTRGLTTPMKMQPVYAPPSKTWGEKVEFFMKKIDEFQSPAEDTQVQK